MDPSQYDSLLLTGAIMLGVLALAFVIATLAMPFLVWGTHTRIAELGRTLGRIESGLSSVRGDLQALSDLNSSYGNNMMAIHELLIGLSLIDWRLDGAPWRGSEAATREIERLSQLWQKLERDRRAFYGLPSLEDPAPEPSPSGQEGVIDLSDALRAALAKREKPTDANPPSAPL